MRVLMVGVYPRGPIRGGVEAATAQLASALSKRAELELHIAAFHRSVWRPFSEVRDGLTLHWLPRWRRGSTLQMISVGAAQVVGLQRIVCPDLLHAQGATPLAVAARFSSRPMVLTVHGLEMLTQPTRRIHTFAGPLGTLRRSSASVVMRLSIERADGVILISPYVREFLGRRVETKLTVAIDNAVAPEFFDLLPPPGAGNLLCVANLNELKNQALLVHAFARLAERHPRATLHLAGPTTNAAYTAKIRWLMDSLNVSERVLLTGEAPPERVLGLYAEADLLVHSSIQETAPLAIAQAMAAGRPVVATAVGGVPNMVRDGVTGFLVPSNDESAMVSAIHGVLSNPARALAMGSAGRTVAYQRFSPDAIADRTLDFYKQVAACAS